MGEARPTAAGGRGGRRGEGRAATLINGSKVELSPLPVFVLGPAGSVRTQEITERESGFIGVAASDGGGGGRGSGGVVRLWEVILRDESWGHSFIAVLIERGTSGRATLRSCQALIPTAHSRDVWLHFWRP